MKGIGIYLILIFLLVREIYSQFLQNKPVINICIFERFIQYEEIFKKIYNIYDDAHDLIFSRIALGEPDYSSSIKEKKCNIAMIEPDFYDKFYGNITDINEYIQETIDTNINDEEDGNLYKEVLSDLRTVDRVGDEIDKTIRALPLFMDYGIFYYRSDIVNEPPKTWEDLVSYSEDIKTQYSDEKKLVFYCGQFNSNSGFYYNLIENVVNTNENLKYKVAEKRIRKTVELFKELFDNPLEIINAHSWAMNFDHDVIKFNPKNDQMTQMSQGDEEAIFMRNWSSYLYNITTEYNTTSNYLADGSKKCRFNKSKILYSKKNGEDHSVAVNKSIYLGVVTKDTENISQYVDVIRTLTSKEFMKYLIKEQNFYDLPVYSSLISKDYDNTDYCKRIDCEFFRSIQQDHVVAGYNVIYQKNFNEKFTPFHNKCKEYFKQGFSTNDDEITIDSIMSLFSDYFSDKYIEYDSTLAIIIMIIVAIEVLITMVVAFYIIKYRNFIEIRRSSPLFLVIMLFGIILAFGSVLTFIGKPNDIICIIRPYIIGLSFGLTFFSLLLKTFRIKVIFDKVNIKVRDSYLIIYLCVLIGIQMILVTIWTFVGGIKSEIRYINDGLHYYTCGNVNSLGSTIELILIIFNGLALLYGCYLAYKVKNVYSEYNESKIIGLSIYGIVICMIILMLISNIENLDLNTLFLIQSLMMILSADILLIFMFTPKLWKLHINNISQVPYEKPIYMY